MVYELDRAVSMDPAVERVRTQAWVKIKKTSIQEKMRLKRSLRGHRSDVATASEIAVLPPLKPDGEENTRRAEVMLVSGILPFLKTQYQHMAHIAFRAARKFNAAMSGFDVTIRQTPDMMPVNKEMTISPILVIPVTVFNWYLVNIISKFCKL